MRTNRKKMINGLFVLVWFLSLLVLNPHLLLAESSLTLTADPTSVTADGTPSLITAVVGGTAPLQNVALAFSTTLGVFSNNSTTINKTTDAAGKSFVTLTSTDAGTASVTCTSQGGYEQVVLVNFTPSTPLPTPTPTPVIDSFVLSVDPPSVIADNISPATISAQLYDQFNKPLTKPGVTVVFASSFTTSPAAHFSNGSSTISVSTDGTGKAAALIYSSVVGIATVNARIGTLTTNPVYVNFTGSGPPAFISLSAAPKWIPADGYSYSAITAVILDSGAQPVAAGTTVIFSTTLGVFENGKKTYSVITTDDTGTVTVYIRATSSNGTAVITCTAGGVAQTMTVGIVQLELESESNNDMARANGICFDNVYLGQLFSPKDEDWYTFTITTPSRIGINFITTAAPADAGCDTGTTTVGTWKVDIRDSNNEQLMSYHNIDCIFDNGIWETGVMPPGTYYIIVYCPMLGTGDYYLADTYYMSVFNEFYFPCGDNDKMVNSASLFQETTAYQLHVPIIDPAPHLWVDFQYDPIPGTSLMFRVTSYGVIENLDAYRACNMSVLSQGDGNYVLHIPVVIFNGVSYRVDLTYVPTTDGQIWFMMTGVWLN